MLIVRITKQFTFEMAHALFGYDGPCRNVHGHSYRLEVTVKGKPIQTAVNPKLGMVMDFGDLKSIVNKHVLDDFDHTLLIYDNSFTDDLEQYEHIFGKIRLVPYQPTCENLLIDIRQRILPYLPENITLEVIRLHETATSFAEIFEADNKV
ncbi:MAG: 6-carboxytetrahydropterin synthase [Bacteroidia bacterium]|nr:6-carboxytetrahydropterin synthase [Bacteroidia bacterium]